MRELEQHDAVAVELPEERDLIALEHRQDLRRQTHFCCHAEFQWNTRLAERDLELGQGRWQSSVPSFRSDRDECAASRWKSECRFRTRRAPWPEPRSCHVRRHRFREAEWQWMSITNSPPLRAEYGAPSSHPPRCIRNSPHSHGRRIFRPSECRPGSARCRQAAHDAAAAAADQP